MPIIRKGLFRVTLVLNKQIDAFLDQLITTKLRSGVSDSSPEVKHNCRVELTLLLTHPGQNLLLSVRQFKVKGPS